MDLFEVKAILKLDTSQFEESIKKSKNDTSVFGDVLKGTLASSAITKGISTLTSGIKTAAGAFKDMASSALNSYKDYEQLVGGVETLFKNASSTVMENAKVAYKTAGMSANEYLETVSSFATSLMQSTANSGNKITAEAKEQMKTALDDQYEATKAALDRQEEAQKKAYDKQYKALQDSLDKKYEARKEKYEKEYDAASEAAEKEIEVYEKTLDKRLSQVEKAQEAEVRAYEEATERKLELIDEEYKESLKNIDREEYERVKAIDEQIKNINGQSDAEQKAREKAEQETKKSELLKAVATAKTAEEQKEAQKKLNDYLSDLAYKEREQNRKNQIEALKEQKNQIKESATAQKNALKEQRDERIKQTKDSRAKELEAIKEANKNELDALKESNSESLKEFKKGKEDELEALKDSEDKSLKKLKESQEKKLESLKDHQEAELSNLKRTNEEKLKAQKKYIEEQKKLLEQENSVTEISDKARQEAAEAADRAARDMADNSNKLGTNIASLQAAYQGFAKGNYTMLDNLKLGYGGTKTEAERLVNEAAKMDKVMQELGITVNKDDLSFGNLVNAISVVQKNMGITGTTTKEAMTTIEGSLNSTKAAWQNVLTAIAGGGDLKQALADLQEAIFGKNKGEGLLNQIIPRLKIIFEGISEFVANAAPIITERLPQLLDSLKPALQSLMQALGDIIRTLIPIIVPVFLEIGKALVSGIVEGLGDLGPVGDAIKAALSFLVATKFISGASALINVLTTIGSVLGGLSLAALPVAGIIAGIAAAVAAAAFLIITNWDKIKEAWGVAVDFFKGIWSGIKGAFSNVKTWLSDKFRSAKESILNTWSNMGEKFRTIRDSIANKFSNTKSWLTDKFISARDNISKGWTDLATRFGKIRDAIANVFKKLPESFATIGRNLMVGMYNGIVEKAQAVIDKVKGVADSLIGFAKRILGENSPSKRFHEIGDFMMVGMAQGIDEGLTDVDNAMGDMEDVIYKRKPSINVVKNASAYGSMDGSGQYFTVPRQQQARQLTVILELDRMMLGRAVYNLNNEETQRVGVKLAGGYA